MSAMLEQLQQEKIVAIFRGITDQQADDAAQALISGGITMMEVTMNTVGALTIVNRWRSKFATAAAIGVGTVLDLTMAKEAVAAGAQFIISPNLDEQVVQYGYAHNVPVWPGCMTPTEIVRAMKAGAEAVKIFPLASFGWKYIAELRGPLDRIPMIATGGVNMSDYFKAGSNAVGMGSQLINMEWIRQGRFDLMTERARQFSTLAKSCL
jgi:2-dehydro-3-deoxyphosphogluconate aldolase/(4S)-4-hydroxy-2-oxoglutarate aldolase